VLGETGGACKAEQPRVVGHSASLVALRVDLGADRVRIGLAAQDRGTWQVRFGR
jgi:hypothetical protein